MYARAPPRWLVQTDRLAGLLDFEAAMGQDVCLVEWPDRMPEEAMRFAKRGVSVSIR